MQTTLATPIGELLLDAGEAGLRACGTWSKRELLPDDSRAAGLHLEQARAALSDYFFGSAYDFSELSLAPAGTPFQLVVWKALCGIPHGTAISYCVLARRIGREKAARSIGRANAKNPISIIQPCHRVVGHDGDLVGFAGGLYMKKWLLCHEGAI